MDAHLLIVHWGFLDACLEVVFIWDFDMLDYWWLILLQCLAYWFWFCHDCSGHLTRIHSPLYIIWLDMLIHLFVYYLDRLWAWCLYHYLSWLSYSRLFCMYMVIYLSTDWLYVAWLPFFCVIACRLSLWVAHLSPCLPPFSFGHFFHFSSHFHKCEALCVLAL